MNPLRRLARKLNEVAGVGIEETMLFELSRTATASPAASDIHIRDLTPDDLPGYCTASHTSPESVHKRWSVGDRCYSVHFGNKLAHFSWVKTKGLQPIYEADMTVKVENGHFWIYHCWTAEWARGRKIYPTVLRAIVNDHFSTGYTCAHIYTSRKNIASQKGILRAGFSYSCSNWALRAGGLWFKIPVRQSAHR